MVSAQQFSDRNQMLVKEIAEASERFRLVHQERWALFQRILIEGRSITEESRPSIIARLHDLLKLIETEGRDLEDLGTNLGHFFEDVKEVRKLAEKRLIFRAVPDFPHLTARYFQVLMRAGYEIYYVLKILKKNNKRERRYIKTIIGHWYTRQGSVADFQKKFSANYSACLSSTMASMDELRPVLKKIQATQGDLSSMGHSIKNTLDSLPGFKNIDQSEKLLLGLFVMGLASNLSIGYVLGCFGTAAAVAIARKLSG